MAEQSPNKRVIFKRGAQRKFLELVRKTSGLRFAELARLSGVSQRYFLEWRKEKYTLPLSVMRQFCTLINTPLPKNIKITEQYAHTRDAAIKGGNATFKKYKGVPVDENKRKTAWETWWNKSGKKNPNPILIRKEIFLPKRSAELAELCGILIGDGGLSKYQMLITLNGETDKKYSKFVVRLLKNLFKIKAKIYTVKNSRAINIAISRRNLVDFLVSQGIKLGNKLEQNVSIPDWIMASKKYQTCCFRGMVDTDGSVVIETHTIKGKKYVYPRLNFTSASPNLVDQSCLILSELGFHPKVRRVGRSVQLENLGEICQYFKVVGSSNPKHLERISPWS